MAVDDAPARAARATRAAQAAHSAPALAHSHTSIIARATAKPNLPCTNRVQCADVLQSLREIKTDARFDLVIADPPYNIGKDFGNASDRQELSAYLKWSDDWIGECLRLVKPCAPVYIYGFAEVLAHIAVRYAIENQRWLAWHYTNKTVPTSKFWQRSHESILCLWRGKRPTLNVDAVREDYTAGFLNGPAGKPRKDSNCRYGRKGKKTVYNAHPNGALPRDVIKVPALAGRAGYAERWFYGKTCQTLCSPKENSAHEAHEIVQHPTQKPAALTQKLIAAADAQSPAVLIPFAGSGSECVVAQKMGADFHAVEVNPDYALLANSWLDAGRPSMLFPVKGH